MSYDEDITSYLTSTFINLLDDDDTWTINGINDSCVICGESFNENDEYFCLFKEVDGEQWCINVHYACGILEQYIDYIISMGASAWLYKE